MRRALIGWLLVLSRPDIIGATEPAPDVVAAMDDLRVITDDAVARFRAGDFAGAEARFVALFERLPPGEARQAALWNIARCHEERGRWAEAAAAFARYRDEAVDATARARAGRRVVTVEARREAEGKGEGEGDGSAAGLVAEGTPDATSSAPSASAASGPMSAPVPAAAAAPADGAEVWVWWTVAGAVVVAGGLTAALLLTESEPEPRRVRVMGDGGRP